MSQTAIRLAFVEDAPVIASIVNEAWKTAYAGIVPQSYLDTLDQLPRARRLAEGLERAKNLRYYIFEADGVPVGAASLHPTHNGNLKNTAEFSFFYFLPAYWRLGYGKTLLAHLKQEAAAQGFERICCWVLEDNHRAISFYESQGMLRDGKRQVVTIGVPLVAVRCMANIANHL